MGQQEEMGYVEDKTTHVAAATMSWTKHWTSGPGHDALLRMVTKFWSRRTVGVLLD